MTRFLSPLFLCVCVCVCVCAWIYDRPFSFLHLCRSKQEVAPVLTSKTVRLWIKSRWKEEEKTLIKTSSAGICCLTAVYIFTQACIIMVCLVCRSSQKLFRSPGVWKAFKHFIRISPLWYKIHAWAKENRRDKHNNWHLLTNFFFPSSFLRQCCQQKSSGLFVLGEPGAPVPTTVVVHTVYFTSLTGRLLSASIWSDLM